MLHLYILNIYAIDLDNIVNERSSRGPKANRYVRIVIKSVLIGFIWEKYYDTSLEQYFLK